ncbi:hypothetical protein PWT90_00486 [Aphanocladium album]|nr:hypothetical protein PWT90_00486 [Aphanocladium album]
MDDKKAGASTAGGFVVRQDGRKPLFGNATRQSSTAQSQETRIPALSRSKTTPTTQNNHTNRPHGSASPATTPGGSRIPRFGSSGGFGSRKPMSLAEAYKLAGEEEDGSSRPGPIDGSPSPAPRSWRARPGDDAKLRRTLNEDPLDSKGAVSPNKDRIAMRNRVDDGIGKSRTSRWVLEEGMRDADAPLPSTENVAPGFEASSPEKSYAWQVDEDFTAGDLQVSNSPRIRVNRPPFGQPPRSASPLKGSTPNTKLEEIRARELGLTPNVGSPRPRTTKLADIMSREKEAEREIPLLERGFPRIGGGHTKLDDIKKLETQGLSRRAIAQAKLEEIKEKNAMTRSVSPDSPRRNWIGREAAALPRSKSAFEPAGRQVPDTPVTIYKSRAEMVADDVRRAAAQKIEERNKEAEIRETVVSSQNRGANGLSPQKRDQSRDLLRKLARAASASPAAPERQPDKEQRNGTTAPPPAAPKPEVPRASSLKRSALIDSSRRRTSNTSSNASKNTSSSDRPTVGFAGLTRSRSTDSRKSKRSSMHSEQDPTDRIEAEERLFAPLDNYSERGSVRAPSPWVDEDDKVVTDADATPRPANKQDLLAMPTPRAPGAYVETPVTVKKEDPEDEARPSSRRRMSLDASVDVRPAATVFRDKKMDLAWRSKDVDTASDPGAAEDKPAKRPRSRSLPRRRPLTNSAKLPSVRDDLRELQRIHNIDDNTLDNLEEILLGKKTSEKLDEVLREIPAAADAVKEMKSEKKKLLDTDRLDDELAAYEALSASVDRDLGVLKTKPKTEPSKQKPTEKHQPEKQPVEEKHHHTHKDEHCPLCVAKPATHTVAYLHLPLPRLFYRSPQLRFTLLGLLLCVLSLWYAAETTMCSLYCRPQTCSGPEPCVWSFDDPTSFGTALPIKLDQWTTGGYGRIAFDALKEDVGDWAADVLDSVRGVRLEDVDAEGMTFAQRRRHRRRMAKKGLKKSMSPEQKAKVDAWRRERLANERDRQRGYAAEESVGGDERVW